MAAVAGAAIFVEMVVAVSSSSGILGAGQGARLVRLAGHGRRRFLTNYLLAFELVSLLLLVGAVAGVVLGAGHLRHASEEGTAASARADPRPARRRAGRAGAAGARAREVAP